MTLKSAKGLVAGVCLLAAVLAFGWALPSASVAERSDEIAAPPATVYEILTDLRFDRRWSPWRDAHSRYLFSGPPFGVGAAMEWTGHTRGSARVLSAEPYRRVTQRLTIDGRAHESEFRLTRSAAGTHVEWRVQRRVGSNPLARWSGLLTNAAMGADLERGLDRLEDIAEPLPHVDLESDHVQLRNAPVWRFAYVEGETARGPGAVAAAFRSTSTTAASILRRAGRPPRAGPVWAILGPGSSADRVRFLTGYPLEPGAKGAPGGLKTGALEAGLRVEAERSGGAAELPQVQVAVRLFLGLHQLSPSGPAMVAFSGDPATTPPERQVVRLITPVRGGT